MPQPHKGNRHKFVVRPVDDVFKTLETMRTAAGVSSMSQYMSDVLAVWAGMPELARELNQGLLQFSDYGDELIPQELAQILKGMFAADDAAYDRVMTILMTAILKEIQVREHEEEIREEGVLQISA
ncbi:hypothetical protein JNN96_37225 [Mycobacterium sp. DSM 3803]|nr:hypothetical protein [Mycobacterium sp. DSM 3803]